MRNIYLVVASVLLVVGMYFLWSTSTPQKVTERPTEEVTPSEVPSEKVVKEETKTAAKDSEKKETSEASQAEGKKIATNPYGEYFRDAQIFKQRYTYLLSSRLYYVTEKNFHQGMGQKILRKFGQIIFDPSDASKRRPDRYVVYNQDKNRLGILTGLIIVKIQTGEFIDNILSQHPLEITYQAPAIRTYHLKLSTLDNIFDIYNKIKSRKDVERVSLEIIENSLQAY